MRKDFYIGLLMIVFFLGRQTDAFCQDPVAVPTIEFRNDKLDYEPAANGDRIPDYSYSGYEAGEKSIPNVPIQIFVPHAEGDATRLIQAALDQVGRLPKDENGIRGAVLLDRGTFLVSGIIELEHGGVVLRGSGIGDAGTTLLGTGKSRNTLVKIKGAGDRVIGHSQLIEQAYVPLNALEIEVAEPGLFKVGQQVLIRRPSTQAWIDKMGMNEFGGETGWLGWKPGDLDLFWDRKITDIQGTTLTLDAPLMMGLDKAFGGAEVMAYHWPGRISQVGLENLTLKSEFDTDNLKDEDHRWMGVTVENVENAWVRQVDFWHFAGSAVALRNSAKKITVEDCRSFQPISEIGGQRRYTFYTQGQQVLFQRCYAEQGYHDFAVGLNAAGPNVFVECESHLPHHLSGGIEGWSTGALFDNVQIDGDALSFKNRGQDGRGAGWTGGNNMFWQAAAALVECHSPPFAYNWAYGTWGQFSGNGLWENTNNHIKPRSLYYAQLEGRLGVLPHPAHLRAMDTEASTSPTYEQARQLTQAAAITPLTFAEWIGRAKERSPIPISHKGAQEITVETDSAPAQELPGTVSIQDGRLVYGDQLLTGKKLDVSWWRGSLRNRDVEAAKPHITRFVPGREGRGLTDNLQEMADSLLIRGFVSVDHNYGLWYDRRRDDHERTRRMDGDVWAPFYEQPFARTGEGTAWDGLSKYDLTRYNPWYWERLGEFASLGEEKGLVLIHQHYFQHNILEAGAHWADSPWRPANNLNDTGFPEPPPYAGDKRIFLDKQFYDVDHPHRKYLHQQYIRQCLDNFDGRGNVLHLTSAEYTGPLHFAEFWLETIRDWQTETGKNALIGLSVTRDVQDALLEQSEWAELVDVVDIRYWHYQEDGSMYAPEGGRHLAPRQHARQLKPGEETMGQVFRAVREMREKYPEKAVVYNTPGAERFGWAVLFAGGSLPALPSLQVEGFNQALAKMEARTSSDKAYGVWEMAEEGENYLFYCPTGQTLTLNLSAYPHPFEILWIDPKEGVPKKQESVLGGKNIPVKMPDKNDCVAWIRAIHETHGAVGP